MSDTRHKNAKWNCGDPAETIHHANTAVLMDIRDELQTLVRLLTCSNFTRLPYEISQIRKHTARIPTRKKDATNNKRK